MFKNVAASIQNEILVAREWVRAISRVISKETEVSQRDSWFHAYGYTAHDTRNTGSTYEWNGFNVVVSGRGEDGRGIVGRNDSKGIRTAVLFK